MANAGFNDETTINANLTGNSTINASLGSVNQTNVNLPPINYIPGYKVAEEERRENEEERISNENAREEYINELKEEVASGAFDGKDGQDGRDGAIQYTAGTGIEITDENVINNTQTSAEWGNISGDIDDQTDLVNLIQTDLANYYTKSQTYTKNEIDSLIAQIPGFNVLVVQTLPVSDIDPHTIYLVPKVGSTNDIYDEYIYINNTWELIGNTQADLTNYYTKSETNTLLGNKQDTLVSGTNIKTINNTSVLGSGDISISGTTVNDSYSTSTTEAYSSNYVNNAIPGISDIVGSSTTDGYSQRYINANIPHMLDQYESSLFDGYSCDYINDNMPTMSSSYGTSQTDGYSQTYLNAITEKNLFTTADSTSGEYLTDSGTTSSSSNWNCTTYIRVEENQIYSISDGGEALGNTPAICFYDSSKTFISGVAFSGSTHKIVKAPANTKYARLSYKNENYVFINVRYDNVYSTDEVRIGTWTNGKPIYRKVIRKTSSGLSSLSNTTTINHGISNLDMTISARGFLDTVGQYGIQQFPLNDHQASSTNILDIGYVDSTKITFTGSNTFSITGDRSVVIILEYTKTTD